MMVGMQQPARPIAVDHIIVEDAATGFPFYILPQHLRVLRERGAMSIQVRVVEAHAEPETPWLRLKEATVLLMRDLGIGMPAARARIMRARDQGKFEATGSMIEPVGFAAWRLDQRDLTNDRDELEPTDPDREARIMSLRDRVDRDRGGSL